MSTTLGKRKTPREPHPPGSTLFVSNLPYTATSTDLQTAFSDLAPVRSAFVVLEPHTRVSKGVGYVVFASTSDAEAAYHALAAQAGGMALGGRTVRVEWAAPKPRTGPRGPDAPDSPGAADVPAHVPRKGLPRRSAAPCAPDPLAVRTVCVGGLPAGIDAHALWKRLRKLPGVDRVDWPARTAAGEEDRAAATVLFASSQHAHEAVSKLHAHVFKGSLLSATLKKRLDRLVRASTGPAPSPASRLIVRNLPFDFSEEDLRAVFLSHGPIFAINMPMTAAPAGKDDSDGGELDSSSEAGDARAPAPRSKGFAFVWMLSRADAEAALRACNGMRVRAGLACALVGDKQRRKKDRRDAKRARVGEDDEGGGAGERMIVVDWALSKDRWEEAKATMEGPGDDVEMTEPEGSEDEESLEESQEESQEGTGDEDTSEDNETEKSKLPQTDTGTTVFIRNVPFAATEDELRELFRGWGPLRYARLTLDADTGRPRGTGFVCFWNRADADRVIGQSETVRAETTGENVVRAPVAGHGAPSLLMPDPSAGIAHDLVLHGRTLDVVRAVPRDEAARLREAGARSRDKADKRNLYLLREGAIFADTAGASSLSPAEVEQRTASFNARRAMLRSNPSLYVSRTRLSVRRLPLFVTERVLKRLALHAVGAFEEEVRAGTREGLSGDEVCEPGQARKGGVRQAKIVRVADRVDAVTGRGRSRGYGFVEMHRHADALRVLRWANNQPEVGPLLERWWGKELGEEVRREKDGARAKRLREALGRGCAGERKALTVEFAVENVQVVRRRAQREGDRKRRG